MRQVGVIILCGLVASCANQRQVLWAMQPEAADVYVGRPGYSVRIDPQQDVLLVEEHAAGALAGSLSESFGLDPSPLLPVPRHAAASYLALFECRVVDIWALHTSAYEVAFACEGERPSMLDSRLCVSGDFGVTDWQTMDAPDRIDCADR